MDNVSLPLWPRHAGEEIVKEFGQAEEIGQTGIRGKVCRPPNLGNADLLENHGWAHTNNNIRHYKGLPHNARFWPWLWR